MMRRANELGPEQLELGLPPTPPRRRTRRVGRPRIHREGEAPHKLRARIKRTQPVHVTLRTTPAARELRRRQTYRAVQLAMYRVCMRRDFRICHISVLTGHMHLVVEADDHVALARGMQGFEI